MLMFVKHLEHCLAHRKCYASVWWVNSHLYSTPDTVPANKNLKWRALHLCHIYTKGQLEENNVMMYLGKKGGTLLKNLLRSIQMVISKLWLGIFVMGTAIKR